MRQAVLGEDSGRLVRGRVREVQEDEAGGPGEDSGRLVRERVREVQEDEAGSPGRRQW